MPTGATTSIGPIEEDLRDCFREFELREDYDSYNEALAAVLEEADS